MSENFLPFGEKVNYWRTSRSSPNTWLDRAKAQIEKVGGKVLGEGWGADASGRAAFMLAFEIGADRFKIVWPVLPSRSNNVKAARIQAATLLFHDVKARAVSAMVLGTRVSFFSYLLLPTGQTTAEMSTPELMTALPDLPTASRITEGES